MADARFFAQQWRRENLSLRRLGELVGREVGGDRIYSGIQVKQWLDCKVTKLDLEYVLAYARACGVPPGWLAFGEERDTGTIPARVTAPKRGLPGVRSTSTATRRSSGRRD